MPRPQTDMRAEKARLLAIAETLLKKQGSLKITLSEVAAIAGMSQSNIYRFFPSKVSLFEEIISSWFEDVEAGLRTILNSNESGEQKIREIILHQLRLKRARFDEDPDLFQALMEMASGNMDLVNRHVQAIHSFKTGAMQQFFLESDLPMHHLEKAVSLAEDMTVLFRDPRAIAARRPDCTDERANVVIDFLIDGLKRSGIQDDTKTLPEPPRQVQTVGRPGNLTVNNRSKQQKKQ